MRILHKLGKSLSLVLQVGLALLVSGSGIFADTGTSGKARVIDAWSKFPISFEANQGQTDKQVKFLARGAGYALFLTAREAVLFLKAGNDRHSEKPSLVPVRLRPKSAASHAA